MKAETPEELEERAFRALNAPDEPRCTKARRGRKPAALPSPIIGGTDDLAAAVAAAWPKAQAFWSKFLLLGAPVDNAAGGSVAQIDLGTRQVSLDLQLVRKKNLCGCLAGILAHEVGHHVRYPGTLAVLARMRLIERGLLPLKDYTLTNLFSDLMINDALRAPYGDDICRVYQSFAADYNWRADPAFIFYLTVYEERWGRAPGSLIGAKCAAEFGREYPGFRAEAQVLGQTLFALGPNLYTQFVYFVSVLSRYAILRNGSEPTPADPYSCGCGDPSAEDWADALTPDAREREAVARARAEGWLSDQTAERMTDAQATDRRVAALPGQEAGDTTRVPEVMAAYYRQQAERFFMVPPAQKRTGESTTPTAIDDWEAGDAVRDIDWGATLLQRGATLGTIQPLKRQQVAEAEGHEVPLWQPRVEVYLDVSGSMPDPRRTRNAMTLAAQVLITGAIRAGGWARVTLYSTTNQQYREWSRSETELSRFLMQYIGGGTEFPFPVLRQSLAECGADQPVRVVITDHDFNANYRARPDNAGIVAEAVARSPHVVLMLHAPDPTWTEQYKATGARVVVVKEMGDYPAMAAALAGALFDRDKGARRDE
jgi:hypothetical protein